MKLLSIQRVGHSDKPSLILVPGWIYPYIEERAFLQFLGSHYYLHLVNLPGYAETADATNPYQFDDLVQELTAYVEEHQLYTAQLMGFSMGARLLMHYLDSHGHSGSVVFVGAPSDAYDLPVWARVMLAKPWLIRLLRKLKPFMRYVVQRALRQITHDPKARYESTTVTLQGAFDSLIALLLSETDWTGYADKATFVYGDRDDYLKAVRDIQPAKLHVIAHAGHNCVRDNEEQMLTILMNA